MNYMAMQFYGLHQAENVFCQAVLVDFLFVSVSYAAKVFRRFVVGQKLADIFGDFASFYRKCANDDQMRWVSLYYFIRFLLIYVGPILSQLNLKSNYKPEIKVILNHDLTWIIVYCGLNICCRLGPNQPKAA